MGAGPLEDDAVSDERHARRDRRECDATRRWRSLCRRAGGRLGKGRVRSELEPVVSQPRMPSAPTWERGGGAEGGRRGNADASAGGRRQGPLLDVDGSTTCGWWWCWGDTAVGG